MFESTVAVFAILWFAFCVWLAVSLIRLLIPRWRRSAGRQSKLALAGVVLTFAGVLASNAFVYLDYGLTSREGLAEARDARRTQRAAEKAAADAETQRKQEQAAREKAEADAKQAAAAAEERRQQEAKRSAEAELARVAEQMKKCSDTTMAFVMSQTFVKHALKAPSTAEFPWITDEMVSIAQRPDCGFRVIAWVDAQNGFGAQIRTRYRTDLKYVDASGAWQLVDIEIE